MSIQPAVQGTFTFFRDLPIVVQSSAAQLTTDAGLLPIREFDDRIGLTEEPPWQSSDKASIASTVG